MCFRYFYMQLYDRVTSSKIISLFCKTNTEKLTLGLSGFVTLSKIIYLLCKTD